MGEQLREQETCPHGKPLDMYCKECFENKKIEAERQKLTTEESKELYELENDSEIFEKMGSKEMENDNTPKALRYKELKARLRQYG